MSTTDLAELFERPPRPRFRIGVGAAVVLVLVILAASIALAAFRPTPSVGSSSETGVSERLIVSPSASSGTPSEADEVPEALLVHVIGAVLEPGVYELAGGSRIVDGIAAAGGLATDADPSLLNLAGTLVDGEQLRVPKLGETAAMPVAPPSDSRLGAGGGAGTRLVNLNTASAAELEELPRIGPAMSSRIIDYREQHGGFSAVEDLKEVAGIGDATYEGLSELVTV